MEKTDDFVKGGAVDVILNRFDIDNFSNRESINMPKNDVMEIKDYIRDLQGKNKFLTNENKLTKNQKDQPVILAKVTSDLILKTDKPMDAMGLYWFYCYTAKWQKTNRIWASVSFVAKGVKWTEQRVREAKKELIKLGLIEIIKQKNKNGSFGKVYTFVKYIHWPKSND